MQSAIKRAAAELAHGLATGFIAKSAVHCPACEPTLHCPLCPDCICSEGSRVTRCSPTEDSIWLVWLLAGTLLGLLGGWFLFRPAQRATDIDKLAEEELLAKGKGGRGVIRNH